MLEPKGKMGMEEVKVSTQKGYWESEDPLTLIFTHLDVVLYITWYSLPVLESCFSVDTDFISLLLFHFYFFSFTQKK